MLTAQSGSLGGSVLSDANAHGVGKVSGGSFPAGTRALEWSVYRFSLSPRSSRVPREIVLLPLTRPTTSGIKRSGGIRIIVFCSHLNGSRDRDLLFHYGTIKLCQSPGTVHSVNPARAAASVLEVGGYWPPDRCQRSVRELVTSGGKSCNLWRVRRVKSVSLDRSNFLPDSGLDHFHFRANSRNSAGLRSQRSIHFSRVLTVSAAVREVSENWWYGDVFPVEYGKWGDRKPLCFPDVNCFQKITYVDRGLVQWTDDRWPSEPRVTGSNPVGRALIPRTYVKLRWEGCRCRRVSSLFKPVGEGKSSFTDAHTRMVVG